MTSSVLYMYLTLKPALSKLIQMDHHLKTFKPTKANSNPLL